MPATSSQSIPNPEEPLIGSNPIGLDLDGLSFTMPKIGKQEITSVTSFSFESLLAVIESHARISGHETVGAAVSFVRASPIVGYAASVAISELFDMALADMLDTIGDIDMKAAIRALNDAKGDSTRDGKHRYRMMAEKSLRDAYEKFQSAIDSRGKKWSNRKLGYGDTQTRIEHGKAAIASSTIAIILKMEALQPGVDTWSDHAREHFDVFDAMVTKEYKEYADNYDTHASEYYSTRLTAGKRAADIAAVAFGALVLKRPLPARNHLNAVAAEGRFLHATEAVAVMSSLNQARQQFETLYERLKSDG